MTYIVGFGIFIGNLFRNKSKILNGVLVVFMFALMVCSYGNADYSTYEMYFEIYGNNLSPAVLLLNGGLFKWFCSLFTKLGLTYRHLLIFMTTIGWLNLYSIANEFIKNKNLVWTLYFIYPFIMDITQIRNFVAMTFLLKGCVWLIKADRKMKNYFMFVIYNLIATLIHITFAFYFILVLIKIVNRNNFKYFASVLLIFELITFGIVQDIISLLTNSDKTTFYFSESIKKGTLLIIISYFLINIHIVRKISKSLPKINWLADIYKMNLVMVLVIPVIYHSFEFMRLYRNIFFLNYIAITYLVQNDLYENKKRSRWIITKSKELFVCMLAIAIFSLYLFILHDYSESVFKPAFENHILF